MVLFRFRKSGPRVQSFKNKFAFEQCIAESGEQVVVVDFNAHWCPPCKYFNPTFQKLSREYPNIIFKRCSVEQDGDNPCHKGVTLDAFPTFKFYKNGKEMAEDCFEGANEQKLRERLKKHS